MICSLRENSWAARQQEIVRRRDRDGEAFLRFFVSADGFLQVRFIEPGSVTTPLSWPRGPRHASASSPSRTMSRPCSATSSRGNWCLPRRFNTAARTSMRMSARVAAVCAGAKKPAPGGAAAAQYEHRGRDSIGDRARAQASRRLARRARSVCRQRRGRHAPQRDDEPARVSAALRARNGDRRAEHDRLRIPRRAVERWRVRHRLASRTPRDRQSLGHAGIYAQQRREQRELQFDARRRRTGDADV